MHIQHRLYLIGFSMVQHWKCTFVIIFRIMIIKKYTISQVMCNFSRMKTLNYSAYLYDHDGTLQNSFLNRCQEF